MHIFHNNIQSYILINEPKIGIQMKKNYDVVLIRHAQSTFNHATQVAAQ